MVAAMLALSPVAANAITVEAGPGGFDNGFATKIFYDDAADRGSANNRDNPLNALGANDGSFFEIGFGSSVDFTFGTFFDTQSTIFEVTFGNPAGFPEAAIISVGQGGLFQFVAVLLNSAAQSGAIIPLGGLGGPFDTIRITDASNPINGALTGGFDIDAVRVSAVPLPAALPLMGAGFAALGFMAWRRKRKAA